MSPPRERTRGLAALVVVTVLWGLSFLLVGRSVEGQDLAGSLLFLSWRFGFASLCFLPVARRVARGMAGEGRVRGGRSASPRRVLAWSVGIGVVNFAGFLLQTVGLSSTTPSRSAFVTMLGVPMVPMVTGALARRLPARQDVAASVVALVGVLVVLSPDGSLAPNIGDLLTLGSAFFFALQVVGVERASHTVPFWALAVGPVVAVAILATLVSLVAGRPEAWPGLLRGAFLAGALCTTLALALMTYGQSRVRPETAAIVFALEPLFASLFDSLAGGPPLGWRIGVGGALILLAIGVVGRGGAGEPSSDA